jgi:hypothetical protein
VGGAGDRQELGEPLDDSEHGRLHEIHGCVISFDRPMTGRCFVPSMTKAA